MSTHSCNFDIIALSETWLNASHITTEFFGPEYLVHRRDRYGTIADIRRGGGVLVAASSTLNAIRVNFEPEFEYLEIVCVKFRLLRNFIFIVCLYIVPDSEVSVYEKYIDAIKSIRLSDSDTI